MLPHLQAWAALPCRHHCRLRPTATTGRSWLTTAVRTAVTRSTTHTVRKRRRGGGGVGGGKERDWVGTISAHERCRVTPVSRNAQRRPGVVLVLSVTRTPVSTGQTERKCISVYGSSFVCGLTAWPCTFTSASAWYRMPKHAWRYSAAAGCLMPPTPLSRSPSPAGLSLRHGTNVPREAHLRLMRVLGGCKETWGAGT